jgi:hypothetical protein
VIYRILASIDKQKVTTPKFSLTRRTGGSRTGIGRTCVSGLWVVGYELPVAVLCGELKSKSIQYESKIMKEAADLKIQSLINII